MGSILQVGKEPIYCSIANRKLFSDYGFRLRVQNEVPAGGYLQVSFPSQYREYLGIPLYPVCNTRCVRTASTVRFYFDAGLVAGQEAYLEIRDVINPDKKGGTGNFEVRSFKGSNSIDENLIFGTIGMGESPKQLRSTSVVFAGVGGSPFAGEDSEYVFNFKTVSFVPKGSYFRITLPKGKGYSADPVLPCAFLAVLGKTPAGSLVCSFALGQVFVNGLGQDLVEGSVLALKVKLRNPPQSVNTPLFRFEVLRFRTQYIYDWKDNLVGPNVLPGRLSSISLTPLGALDELAMGKTDGLQLTFTTKNPVQAGGMVEVKIPSSFSFLDLRLFDKPISYYVLSGLTPASSSERIVLTYVEESTA